MTGMPHFIVFFLIASLVVTAANAETAPCDFPEFLQEVDASIEEKEATFSDDLRVSVAIRRALASRLWQAGDYERACEKIQSVAGWLGISFAGLQIGETLDEFLRKNEQRVEQEIDLGMFFGPKKVLSSEIPNLRDNSLRGADFRGKDLQGKWLAVLDLDGAILQEVNLQGAILAHSSLRDALLMEADLTNSWLVGADLQGAVLHQANLSRSYMRETSLIGADLWQADLSDALLKQVLLEGADFSEADVAGLIFEPVSGSLPAVEGFSRTRNLHLLTYDTTPRALIEMRHKLREQGLRKQEREITYAIEHTAMQQASTPDRLFKFVLFDITCRFGLSPWRPIIILLSSIPFFALFYIVAMHSRGRSGIWVSSKKVHDREGGTSDEPERVKPTGIRLFFLGIYFSALSAFRIGWRDFNISVWLESMTPSGRTLRGTGWVRPVSAIQAVLSVYLFALWISTYFGRIFG